MDYCYVVRIRVCNEIYHDYSNWLQDHIEGNASRGIRGMMEIRHNGRYLFPSVEVFTTDPIDGCRLMSVHYYTDDPVNIQDYLDEHAPKMRGDMPDIFREYTAFNRFVANCKGEVPLGSLNEALHAQHCEHEDLFYNLASFDIY